MSWAGCLLGTDQPGWLVRVDLPLVLSRRPPRLGQRRPHGPVWVGDRIADHPRPGRLAVR